MCYYYKDFLKKYDNKYKKGRERCINEKKD